MSRAVLEWMFRPVAVACAVLLASCGGSNMGVGPTNTPLKTEPTTTSTVPALGNFELTFAADRSCTGLPEEARTRRYTATLQQGGSLARLGGALFPASSPYGLWNAVSVRIADDSLDAYFNDPPIWESLSDSAYVVIYGDAHGRLVGDSAIIPFWARFEYCPQREPDGYPECAVPVTTCESRTHQLILSRK